MNGGSKGTSPWVYVGVGCGVSALLAISVGVSVGLFGYRKVKELQADMKDPAARAARVQRVLGGQKLPDGYHPVIGLSIPLVIDMAIISDKTPDAEGRMRGLGRRGFIFISSLNMGRNQDELKDYFEGKTDDADVLRRNRIRLNARELIKRGVIRLPGHTLYYLAQRGDLRMEGDRVSGLTTLMLIECPGDEQRQRMGIWFGPDPTPDAPAQSADFTGTPADENAIREFTSNFALCGK